MSEQLLITVQLSRQDVETVAAIVYDCARVVRMHLSLLGERKPPTWEFAEASARHDAEVVVRRIAEGKMRSGIDIHNQWRDEQYKQGWRYGTNDITRMTSPYICEFSALPPEAQTRYHIAFAVATTALANIALIAAGRKAAQHPH